MIILPALQVTALPSAECSSYGTTNIDCWQDVQKLHFHEEKKH